MLYILFASAPSDLPAGASLREDFEVLKGGFEYRKAQTPQSPQSGATFLDRTAREWVNDLLSQDSEVSDQAATKLMDGGSAAIPVVRAILELPPGAFDHPAKRTEVMAFVLGVLRQNGEAATAATPQVLRLVQREQGSVREAALACISRLKPPPDQALPVIIDVLRKDNYDLVQATAIYAIGEIRADTPAARKVIEEFMDNTRSKGIVRAHAALAWSKVTGDRDRATAVLNQVAQSSDFEGARIAKVLLGEMRK
ncbi:MAG: HEAT repeat domain-containing protein [Phycisphaerales bacterium]